MDYSSPEKEKMITYFTVLTSSSKDVARSFLETHQWNLFTAASSFNENQATIAAAEPNVQNPSDEELIRRDRTPFPNLRINIPDSSLPPSDDSPSQLRLQSSSSPSQPSRAQYFLGSKRAADSPRESQTIKRRQTAGNIRTLTDLLGGSDSVSDEADQENEGGEETSDMENKHEEVTFIVTLWRNGLTVDDGPLMTLDDPENVNFLESIQRLKSPREIHIVHVIKLIEREEEDFTDAFHGVGRTLAGSNSVSTEPPLTTTQPSSSTALLVVDHSAPTTTIQIRLADGTSLVTLFNTHHTIRDVRGFIDASRPDDSKDYQLLIMGIPPKPLPDLDQTIEKADIINSLLIQKY